MLKLKPNCKTCQAVKENKKLLSRIYNSSYYIPHSKDSLARIHADVIKSGEANFSYIALLNHCKKHQHLNAGDYTNKMLKIKAKQAELGIISDRFEAVNVQDAVINMGMEKLENGELKIDANHLLKAAKDKQDAQAKVRDQQLQLAEMVAFFTSGEDNLGSEKIDDRRIIELEDYNPAVPVTQDSDTWQN
jgi:hypothetical protein